MKAGLEVVVEPHNPDWARKFDQESRQILRVLGPAGVAIHHIGSTAIPGIYAKPIIDILVEAISVDAVDSRTEAMAALGCEAMGEFGLPRRRYFRKDNGAGIRQYQVHAFAAASMDIARHIAFRDFLRTHSELAQQYSELKRRLATQHRWDIQGYMDGKDSFIKETERLGVESLSGKQDVLGGLIESHD